MQELRYSGPAPIFVQAQNILISFPEYPGKSNNSEYTYT